MTRNTARVTRRRRVLNEEVLSASNLAVHSTSSLENTIEPGDSPRYGAGANIENHPQVTSFVPRRFRTLCLITCVGLGAGAVAEMAAHYAEPLSKMAQVVTASEITTVFANRLVAWSSAMLLLGVAVYARLIFSLRRHRVDDVHGRYRVWRTASWVAGALSLNAVLGAHVVVARCLGNLVDWQWLPASAGWWLIPAATLGMGLLIKLMIDASECQGALAVYLLAVGCLVVAQVHSAGWLPAETANWTDTLNRTLPLAGYTMLLVGSLLFARYVILDVQGLIDRKILTSTTTTQANSSNEQLTSKIEQFEEATVCVNSSVWVDGSEPEFDEQEQDTRKLSKTERKRLRKQKQHKRAA